MALELTPYQNKKAGSSTSTPKQPTSVSENEIVGKGTLLGENVHPLDKMLLDIDSKNYPTDADVLDAVCSCTRTPNDSLVLRTTSQHSKEKMMIGQSASSDLIGTNYWSDEELRYPPQMSLSPTPERAKYRKFIREKKREMKQQKRDLENVVDPEIKQSPTSPTDKNVKLIHRRNLIKLTPISARIDNDLPRAISPNVTSPTKNQNVSSSSKTSFRQEPYEKNDLYISSPSLVRPIITGTPMTFKDQGYDTSNLAFQSSMYRRKQDDLFDSQRSVMPHRHISRSKSTNTTSSPPMFPEITSITSQVRRNSKSLSDFRESPSIFDKLLKKNPSIESLKEKDDSRMGGRETEKKSSSSSKACETTRRKLRRILSLH